MKTFLKKDQFGVCEHVFLKKFLKKDHVSVYDNFCLIFVWKKTILAYDYNWGRLLKRDKLLCLKGRPTMPISLLNKRNTKNMKKGTNGSQMGLFSDLIRLKCISDHSPSFWKTYFCLKKSWSMKALDKVLDTSDDAETHPKGRWTCLETSQISIFLSNKSSYRIIIYDDRL